MFAFGWLSPEILMLNTIEDEATEYDDDVPVTLDELGASIRRILGADLPLGEPQRLTRYQFHARQAERYRDGRIFLAGDSAHQYFPAGGYGANTGIADAADLGWKLAAVINGWADPALLDSYEAERHFAGRRAMLQTQAQVALRRGHDAAADALREVFLELLTDEQPQRRLAALIAATDTRYPGSDDPLVGTFAKDLPLGEFTPACPPRPRRPGRPARGGPRLGGPRRRSHGGDRGPARRGAPDPPGRPHRLGRRVGARAARSANRRGWARRRTRRGAARRVTRRGSRGRGRGRG